jgi:hypothetical protein
MGEWLESDLNLTFGTGLGIDIETCLACGGAVRIIACIEASAVTEKIVTHLDAKALKPEASMRPPGRAPPYYELLA